MLNVFKSARTELPVSCFLDFCFLWSFFHASISIYSRHGTFLSSQWQQGKKARYTFSTNLEIPSFKIWKSFLLHAFRHKCLQCPRLRSDIDSWALEPCPASSPAPVWRGPDRSLRPQRRTERCWAAAGRSRPLWSKRQSLRCRCCPDDCVCRWKNQRGGSFIHSLTDRK